MKQGKIVGAAIGLGAIGAFLYLFVKYRDEIANLLFPSEEKTATEAPASQYVPLNPLQNIQSGGGLLVTVKDVLGTWTMPLQEFASAGYPAQRAYYQAERGAPRG